MAALVLVPMLEILAARSYKVWACLNTIHIPYTCAKNPNWNSMLGHKSLAHSEDELNPALSDKSLQLMERN